MDFGRRGGKRYSTVDYCSEQIFAGIHAGRGKLGIGPKLSSYAFYLGHSPEHIKKMCDAIVVVAYKGKGYLFCIEQKSGYKGDYKKQLVNGAIFCQWLMALFEAHDYFNQKPIYVGLLVFAPRARAERKGLTSHREDKPEAFGPINPFDKCYRMINQNEIRLGELCKIASRSARSPSASSPERGRNGNANHTIFSSSQGPDGY